MVGDKIPEFNGDQIMASNTGKFHIYTGLGLLILYTMAMGFGKEKKGIITRCMLCGIGGESTAKVKKSLKRWSKWLEPVPARQATHPNWCGRVGVGPSHHDVTALHLSLATHSNLCTTHSYRNSTLF